MTDRPGNLLEVRDLHVRFGAKEVVCGVSFDIAAGEKLALVGESGSGKTITALSLLRLAGDAVVQGRAVFEGRDLLALSEREMRGLRGGDIAMIFQEPMTALNPLMTVGRQISEVLELKQALTQAQSWLAAIELIASTGIPEPARRAAAFPHQLSGGQRQRVMIAMALACKPDLIVADEPTSALDVTVQAQIVALLRDLIAETGTALILISHDLAVIGQLADRVVVMYAGQSAEEGPTAALYGTRAHPYTQGLFAALPGKGARKGKRLIAIPGTVPAPDALPPGCPFHGRCPRGQQVCHDTAPPWAAYPQAHRARCFFPGSGA